MKFGFNIPNIEQIIDNSKNFIEDKTPVIPDEKKITDFTNIPGFGGGGKVISPFIPNPKDLINDINTNLRNLGDNIDDFMPDLPDPDLLTPDMTKIILTVGGVVLGAYVIKKLWWKKAMSNKETMEELGITKEGVSKGVDTVIGKSEKAVSVATKAKTGGVM